jgi:hypothetical protein
VGLALLLCPRPARPPPITRALRSPTVRISGGGRGLQPRSLPPKTPRSPPAGRRPDGAGEGAGASGSFSGRGYPTMAKIVPLCSAGARAVHAALRRRQRLAPGIQARSELRRDAVSMFDLPYRIRCDLRASSRVGWQQTPRPRLRFRLVSSETGHVPGKTKAGRAVRPILRHDACLIGQGQRPGFSDAAVIGDCRVHGRRFNNLCFCNMASELRANARNAQKTVAAASATHAR